MNKFHVVIPLILLCTGSCLAADYDFDKIFEQNDNASTAAPTKSKMGDLVDGATRQADQFDAQNRRTKEKIAEAISQASQSVGSAATASSGRLYDCEYSCRTNGFILYDGTDKFHQTVKANESWQAEKVIKESADKHCRSLKGNNNQYMWETDLRCKETK
ncbi:MAG: hypothetical protein HXX17_07075 [Geobacteraceae bacterium]|nr:hypothetical protein [Geobacteraceae bacterium]